MTGAMLNTRNVAAAGNRMAALFWRVVAPGPGSETLPDMPPARFVLDAGAPPQVLPPGADSRS